MLLLLSCATDTGFVPGTVEGTLHACAPYRDVSNEAYGYCIGKYVVGVPRLDDVKRLCPEAGAWEGACRDAWVEEQVRRNAGDVASLIDACGDNQACAFRVLDPTLGGDVLVAIRNCQTLVPNYLYDCVGHALSRWVETHPDDAEAARVMAGAPAQSPQIADYIGMAEACFDSAHCDSLADASKPACTFGRDEYRRGVRRCPGR